MGSAGQGSGTHLQGELFQSMARVKFTHVPYKGGAAASVAIVSGQVHLAFDQVSSCGPFIKAGRLRALAVTTPQRSKLLPAVPTIDESGLRGYDYSTWTTLGIPAATPKEVVQKLRDAVDKVIAQPRTRPVTTSGTRSRLVYGNDPVSKIDRGLCARLSRYGPVCSVPYHNCIAPCVVVGKNSCVNA